ncbi:MAG: alpha/beta hydrolase [Alphaproteobacteria bacterium]|nr:alpha/beta hydrolase [Alphaproteobacteria bacterium]
MIRRLALRLALTALAGLVLLGPRPAAAAARAPAETRLAHISIVALGRGSPVVLVPGLASPRDVWDGVAADLARSHRVYLVQVNGFGGDAPGANLASGLLDGVVADLSAALVADRAGPVRFVGHSMGGLLALKFASVHRDQVDRLMIVDALPDFAVLLARGGPMPGSAQIEAMAATLRTATAARYGRTMTQAEIATGVDSLALTPAARTRMRAWSARADARVAGQAIYEDMTSDLRPALPGIAAPITVVVPWTAAGFGKDRTLAFYAAQYAGAPNVRFVPIAEAGHFVMLDQPAAFRAALEAFLVDG